MTTKLTITIDAKQPTYEFTGDWAAHDLNVILRGLRRQYLLHQRTVRRTGTKLNEPTEPTKLTKPTELANQATNNGPLSPIPEELK